jgi:hypothetical protein
MPTPMPMTKPTKTHTASSVANLSPEMIMRFCFKKLNQKKESVEGISARANKLPEPSLSKTMQLINRFEKADITIYRKTLREPWNH